jgi:hypothetical protein
MTTATAADPPATAPTAAATIAAVTVPTPAVTIEMHLDGRDALRCRREHLAWGHYLSTRRHDALRVIARHEHASQRRRG